MAGRYEAVLTAAEKNVCSTKYPLLLVHGVGFRDFPGKNF